MTDFQSPRVLLWVDDSAPNMFALKADANWEQRLTERYSAAHKILVVKANAAELISEYVGETEANIRRLFKWTAGADYDEKSISAVLIIIDAFELIARGVDDDVGDSISRLYARSVTTLLLCLDGIDSSKTGLPVALVAKSNTHPDMLDQRLLRPGRLWHHQQLQSF